MNQIPCGMQVNMDYELHVDMRLKDSGGSFSGSNARGFNGDCKGVGRF